MERLTKRIPNTGGKNIVVFTKGLYKETTAGEMTGSDIRLVLRTLANYEDLEEQGLLLRKRCGEWESESKIEVEDVVQNIANPNIKVLITRKYADETYDGIDASGATFSGMSKNNWKKTGRHYDIEAILKKFREES